nr:unnamed protein product [Haemonchus contortus]
MACIAVHSHLLVSLLTIYGTIILLLLVSGSWDMSTKSKTTSGEDTFNVEGFKVMSAVVLHCLCFVCVLVCLMANNITKCSRVLPPIVIITIMVFNSIFNIGACIGLWLHKAPKYPGGYSRAVLSTITLVYTLVIASLFCCRYPAHSSQKPPSSAVVLVAHTPKEGDEKGAIETQDARAKARQRSADYDRSVIDPALLSASILRIIEGSKEATKERKRLSAENKRSDKEGKKKLGSKQKDESEEPKKGSKEAISGSKSALEAPSGIKAVTGDKIG